MIWLSPIGRMYMFAARGEKPGDGFNLSKKSPLLSCKDESGGQGDFLVSGGG